MVSVLSRVKQAWAICDACCGLKSALRLCSRQLIFRTLTQLLAPPEPSNHDPDPRRACNRRFGAELLFDRHPNSRGAAGHSRCNFRWQQSLCRVPRENYAYFSDERARADSFGGRRQGRENRVRVMPWARQPACPGWGRAREIHCESGQGSRGMFPMPSLR